MFVRQGGSYCVLGHYHQLEGVAMQLSVLPLKSYHHTSVSINYFAARPYLCVDVKELSCRSFASLQVVGGLHTFLPLNESGVCGISMSYLIYINIQLFGKIIKFLNFFLKKITLIL